MDKQNTKGVQASTTDDDDFDEYDDMEKLEILESLREDMEELGVTTLSEIIRRIDELHQKLDKK
ncbi:MAG: hypothetical protein PVS3B3_21440 [Ktedonobacteraceae bacterium]